MAKNDWDIPHWDLNEKDEVIYVYNGKEDVDHNFLPNYGTRITKAVAIKIIDNYVRSKAKQKDSSTAFTFGINGLNKILGDDKECKGIRFWLAKKRKSDLSPEIKEKAEIAELWKSGLTLVAMGVRLPSDGESCKIGYDPELIYDFVKELKDKLKGISSLAGRKKDSPIIETVPSYKLNYL